VPFVSVFAWHSWRGVFVVFLGLLLAISSKILSQISLAIYSDTISWRWGRFLGTSTSSSSLVGFEMLCKRGFSDAGYSIGQ
jgi:hypothetical protein